MMPDPTDCLGHYSGCACEDCDPVAAAAWLEWAEATMAEDIEAMMADEAAALEVEPLVA